MAVKGNSKLKGKLVYGLKNDLRKLIKIRAVKSLKICTLIGSFCPKLIKKKSYVSWQCRVMQSLKKNWLLIPKMTGEIQWVFTQPLKSPIISLRLAILVQSIYGLGCTDELPFMTLKLLFKTWLNLTLRCQKWHEELSKSSVEQSKVW